MAQLLNTLPYFGEAFLRLFYPSLCATCHSLLELEEKGICGSCWREVQKLELLPSEERIRVSFSYGDEGWALFRYEGSVKEIVHLIKFGRRRDLIKIFEGPIASFMARRTQLAHYDMIVPIPLDARRRMERHFNQSGLISKMIHPFMKRNRFQPSLERRLLLKKHSTHPQSLLGKQGRKLNVEGVFRVIHSNRVSGKSVLLIDDLFTTGATFEEAAKALKAAGAVSVGYLALVRTLIH